MKLSDLIENLESLPEDAILFAERIGDRFTPESSVVALSLNDQELKMPTNKIAEMKAPGTEYFLEAFLVNEMAEELLNQGRNPQEALEQIIHYAEHDA